MTNFIFSVLKESYHILKALFRVLVPMIVLIKLLDMAGAVSALGSLLEPIMFVAGLPGEMGLVWASALATNIYGGVVVFAAVAQKTDISAAQATVIGSMMLMAHAIPVEVQIAKKAGTRFIAMGLFRVLAALVFGILLNQVYLLTDTLQYPAKVLFSPSAPVTTLTGWAFSQISSLAWISVIVVLLVLLMKILNMFGIINLINTACGPLLKIMGIGNEAAYVTMVGFTLGLTYGGGLIIKEAKSGKLSHRDVFFSLAFMGICHSMIEDTLIMVAIGGHISGLLWLRTVFAVLIVAVMVRILNRLPERIFYRYLFLN